MPTYLQLQDRVKRRVIDLPAAVTAEVPDLINEAMRELQDDHNFKVMEEETSVVTTTLATRALTTIPTDFKELRLRPYRLDDQLGQMEELGIAPNRNALLRWFDNEEDGFPQWLLDPDRAAAGTGSFEVWPLPDGNSDYGDGEYRIVIPYWKYLPALSASGDTNWFTTAGPAYRFLIFKATAEAFFLDWDENRGAVWEQKAAAEKAKAIKQDKMLALGGHDTFVPYKGVYEAQLDE